MDPAKIASVRTQQSLSVKIDHFFVILIVLTGFLVYVHHLAPEVELWKAGFFEILLFNGYTVQSFVYAMVLKLVPIILFTIWFLSDDRWWRWGILFPLGYLFYQLLSIFNESFNWFSGRDVIDLWPYVTTYLLVVVLVRYKLGYHLKNIGRTNKIGAENLYIIPGQRLNHARIQRVKDLLLEDRMGRKQLQLVYREYDFIKRLSADLESSHGLNHSRMEFLRSNYPLKLIFEVAVFLLLLFMPVIFNVYRLTEPGVQSYDMVFFRLHHNGFADVFTLLWVFSTKFAVILPVSLWFFTSRYWWKYFLLIPFSVFGIQVFELFKPVGAIDGMEFFMALPIALVILLVMLVFTMRIRRYLDLKEFYEVMEVKINETVSDLAGESISDAQKCLKEELHELMSNHKSYPPEAYLKALKEIKGRLEDIEKKG